MLQKDPITPFYETNTRKISFLRFCYTSFILSLFSVCKDTLSFFQAPKAAQQHYNNICWKLSKRPPTLQFLVDWHTHVSVHLNHVSQQVLHTYSFIMYKLVGFGGSLSFVTGWHIVQINHRLLSLMTAAGKLGMLEIPLWFGIKY